MSTDSTTEPVERTRGMSAGQAVLGFVAGVLIGWALGWFELQIGDSDEIRLLYWGNALALGLAGVFLLWRTRLRWVGIGLVLGWAADVALLWWLLANLNLE